MQNFVLALIALVVIAGGWYWYSQTPTSGTELNVNIEDTMPQNVTPPVIVPASTTAATSTAAVKQFTVTNSGMTFTTKTLSAKKGERVKVTFNNAGGTHDLRIDGYDVGTKVIKAGESDSFEFVADKAGTFEYYCSVGQHRANGMVGAFTVTP